MSEKGMKIGFIGLGIMGKPMAGRLIDGGHTLFLHSRSGVPEELLKQGGRACSSPEEVAQNADIIITMLPDTPDVERVLFGQNGVVSGLKSGLNQGLNQGLNPRLNAASTGLNTSLSSGKIVIDMSSISPIETR